MYLLKSWQYSLLWGVFLHGLDKLSTFRITSESLICHVWLSSQPLRTDLVNGTPAVPFITVSLITLESRITLESLSCHFGWWWRMVDDDLSVRRMDNCQVITFQELWDLLESLWGWLVSSEQPFQSQIVNYLFSHKSSKKNSHKSS